MLNKREKILVPLISIVFGILLGCLFLIMNGKNPWILVKTMVRFLTGFSLDDGSFNARLLGENLSQSLPLILSGFSVGFAYRAGMFNIGAEGQVIMGTLVSAAFVFMVPLPGFIRAIGALLAGGLAGALWAFIPGILKAKFNIQEVVIGIMLNYTAMHVSNYFMKLIPGSTLQGTAVIPDETSFSSSFLSGITGGSSLNWGIIVVILMCLLYWFIIEKTSFGYGLRATGFNKEGARYAGMKINSNLVYSIMISGFFAGLAGAIMVLGIEKKALVLSTFNNIGFDGIAVALVGNCSALGSMVSGVLFSLLKSIQPGLESAGVSKEIGIIVSSSIVFFVAIQYAIKFMLDKIKKGLKKEGEEV